MVLGAESNEKFYHSVPTQEGVKPRVSITFRKVNTFKVDSVLFDRQQEPIKIFGSELVPLVAIGILHRTQYGDLCRSDAIYSSSYLVFIASLGNYSSKNR